ncbi:hypothetical protein BRD17_10140 [Halobacteriales archaeon SW_7_68_16]|nr:MAG: hypothetical protein BRD17_10140 [Halobacteriales archaeon SW_7_68_16]
MSRDDERRGADRARSHDRVPARGRQPGYGDRTPIDDERGVSQVIGFTLSFSVVILSLGLIFTQGFGSLTDLRGDVQETNAVRAFEALAENFDDLQRSRAPTTSGELRLGGNSLTIRDNITWNVTVTRPGEPPIEHTLTPQSLVYRSDVDQVSYEAGAVLRESGGDSLMLRRPPFLCTGQAAIVSVINVDIASDTTGIGSSGSVLLREDAEIAAYLSAQNVNPVDRLGYNDHGTHHVGIVVAVERSDNLGGWNDYFSGRSGWTQVGDDTYRCDADRVVFRESLLEVEFVT